MQRSVSALYDLIQRLDKGEKRHVRLALAHGAGRKARIYQQLFDLLGKMKHYDPAVVAAKVPAGRESSTQSRLLAIVLKDLRGLRELPDDRYRPQRLLQEAEILAEKDLYTLARRQIRKAEKIALQREDYASLLQTMQAEQEFILRQPQRSPGYFADLARREADCLEKLHRKSRLQRLNTEMRTFAREFLRARDPEAQARCAEIYTELNGIAEPSTEEFYARIYRHNIRSLYHLAHNEVIAFDEISAALELWRNHPQRVRREPDFFLGIVNNYLAVAWNFLRLTEFRIVSRELRARTDLPGASQFKFTRISYQQEMLIYLNWGVEDAELEHFLAELVAWLEQEGARLAEARRLAFYYNLMMVHFVRSEFRRANRWAIQIAQFAPGPDRHDIRDFTRIFQAILQIELGDPDLQDYFTRSAYRYFNRTNKLAEFEGDVVRLIRGLQRWSPGFPKREEQVLRDFRQRLRDHAAAGQERLLGLTELQFWTEARLRGVTLKEYYRERLGEREVQ